eukprot:scaffold29526_cov73-Phaeocystis_antarctica.AAC.4
MSMRVRDAQTGGHGCAGLTELQGVTADFWGGPQLHTYGLRRPGPSLARMYGTERAAGPQGAVCRQRMTPAWIERLEF